MSNNEADPRRAFVIHGHNEPAPKGLFDFLRAIGPPPIEWSEAISMTGNAAPYIGDVLDAAFCRAQAVVVLQTPDDVAHLHESLTYPGDPETSPQMHPRPNVLYEAGMAQLQSGKTWQRVYATLGVRLSLDGTDWHDTGDLTLPSGPGGGLP